MRAHEAASIEANKLPRNAGGNAGGGFAVADESRTWLNGNSISGYRDKTGFDRNHVVGRSMWGLPTPDNESDLKRYVILLTQYKKRLLPRSRGDP